MGGGDILVDKPKEYSVMERPRLWFKYAASMVIRRGRLLRLVGATRHIGSDSRQNVAFDLFSPTFSVMKADAESSGTREWEELKEEVKKPVTPVRRHKHHHRHHHHHKHKNSKGGPESKEGDSDYVDDESFRADGKDSGNSTNKNSNSRDSKRDAKGGRGGWDDNGNENEAVLSEDEAEATRTYMFLDPASELTKLLDLRSDIVLFDAAKMHHDHFHRKISLADCIEEGRRKLVHAMRYGLTLVIALRTVSPDFIGLFNDNVLDASIVAKRRVDPISKVQVFLEKDRNRQMLSSDIETSKHKQRIDTYSKEVMSSLPAGFLLHQGKHLLEGRWAEQLFRRADREGPRDAPRTNSRFQIILTTELDLDELDAHLFDGEMGLPRRPHFNIVHHNTEIKTVLNELALPEEPAEIIMRDRLWTGQQQQDKAEEKDGKEMKQITY